MKLTRIFEIRVNLSGINFLSPVPATGKGMEIHDISDNECKGSLGYRDTEKPRCLDSPKRESRVFGIAS